MLAERTRSELLRQAHANFAAAYRVLAEAVPAGAVAEIDCALGCVTGVLEPEFNRLFVNEPPADPAGMLREAKAFFAQHDMPWMLVAAPEVAEELREVAPAAGLSYSRPMPGMLLAPLAELTREVEGLEIQRVTDAGLAAIYVGALATGYGAPGGLFEVFGAPGTWDTDETESFIGWLDGNAVGTATLVLSGEMAGVYNISAAPAFRRRGVGAAMTAAAIAAGRERGARASTLQASAMGFPLYLGMGYEAFGSYRGWTFRAQP